MALLIKCWWYGGLNSDIEPTDVTSPCYRNGSGWDVIDNDTPIYNSASTPENSGTSVATTEGCYGVWIFDEEPTITQDPAGGVSNWFYIKWQSEGQWLVGVQSTDFGNDTFYGDYPSFSTKSEWLEYITNPKDVTKPHVLLKWSDPPNITDWEPTPCNWEGTVVIRKEDSPPMHRWDGIKIVGNKRRDKYKTKGYKDEDIKMGMTYYYGFFPYYTADDSDPNHPLRYYRFTKVIKVETGDNSLAPIITSITVDGNSAAINYSISEPDGSSFTSVKLYGKIGSSPACDNTDDIIEDVDPTLTSITCNDLEEGKYYFCIQAIDLNDTELTSNVEICAIEFYYLFDSTRNYINPLFENFSGNSGASYNSNSQLVIQDTSQGQRNIYYNFKIKRGKATKMYLDCSTQTKGGRYYDSDVRFYNTPPDPFGSGQDIFISEVFGIGWWGGGHSYPSGIDTLTGMTVERDITDIDSNKEFYFGYYANQTNFVINKIWFNGPIEIIENS